ncbi:hypothetical protein pdam_00019639, partial [Pocillopora damicornis]
MYFSTIDRLCVELILFSTVLLNIAILKIGLIVVQWENENSRKSFRAVELKEGTTVDIPTGTIRGRVAIYKATILKVCDVMESRYKIDRLLDYNIVTSGLSQCHLLKPLETR